MFLKFLTVRLHKSHEHEVDCAYELQPMNNADTYENEWENGAGLSTTLGVDSAHELQMMNHAETYANE